MGGGMGHPAESDASEGLAGEPSLVGRQQQESVTNPEHAQRLKSGCHSGGYRRRRKSSVYRGRVCNISSAKAKHRVQVLFPRIRQACSSRGGAGEGGSVSGCEGDGAICDSQESGEDEDVGGLGSVVQGMGSHSDDEIMAQKSALWSMASWMRSSTSRTFLGAKGMVVIAAMVLQYLPRISGQAPDVPVTATAWEEFKSHWMLPTLMITSMVLQLVQISTGGTRKWYRTLQAVSWLAYNTADAVAVYTLGALGKLCDERKQVYGLWAAILLFHLGGPDNISAYSIADAELWKRHGFQMIFQVVTAFFVVFSSADGTILWISLVLAAVGTVKYAERTLALYHASEHHLDKMARPLYKLMQYEHESGGSSGGYNYFVLGEKQAYDHAFDTQKWYHQVLESLQEQKWFNTMFGCLSPSSPVQPVEPESDKQAVQRKIREPFEVVMLSDLMDPEHREALERQTPGNGRNVVNICIAFALFKMFRRRLTSLYMHEWSHNKIRNFFFVFLWGESSSSSSAELQDPSQEPAEPSRERLVDVLDMELRFMFDSMFTKSSGTAYTWFGPVSRALFLFAIIKCSVVFFKQWDKDLQLAGVDGTVTWILFASVILVEVMQLARLTLTDWTRVWLTCMYVIGSRQHRKLHRQWLLIHTLPLSRTMLTALSMFLFKAMAAISLALLSVVNFRLFGLFRRRYWKHQFGQVSLIPVREEEFDDRQSVPEPKVRAFKVFLLGKVFDRCKLLDQVRKPKDKKGPEEKWKLQDLKDTMASVAGYTLFGHHHHSHSHGHGRQDPTKFTWASSTDLENAIVTWHVATSLLEAHEINRKPDYQEASLFRILFWELKEAFLGTGEATAHKAAKDKEMSQYMSRYTLYLLKERTQLLPSNAALARGVFWRTKRELRLPNPGTQQWSQEQGTPASRKLLDASDPELRRWLLDSRNLEWYAHQPWKAGRILAVRLNETFPASDKEKRAQMWAMLGNVWADLLIAIAVAVKPKEHVELLTEGGEFITHIWVLLGHMGFGAGPNLGNMGHDAAGANA